MNQGGEAAAQGGQQQAPDEEQQQQVPHVPQGDGADQVAQGGAIPPPQNANIPPGAADQPQQPQQQHQQDAGQQQNQHRQNSHGGHQGMPQAQPHVPLRRAQFAQHPRHQTMGDFDSSDAFFLDRNPIRPPQPPRNDFEIKPQIIDLVKQNQFHGLSTEHPLDHVDTFKEICSTTRINGVSPDYFRCKLFIFSLSDISLSDKALRWVKSLLPQSITSITLYKEQDIRV